MWHVQSPNNIDMASSAMRLFLAGSIDLGMVEDWRSSIVDRLKDLDVVVLNPRRDTWAPVMSTEPAESESEELRRQINWELDGIECADLLVFYFVPGAKSPISLLELGLIARQKQAIVCCPRGFWRKMNVDVVCERFGIPQVDSLENLVTEIRERVRVQSKPHLQRNKS